MKPGVSANAGLLRHWISQVVATAGIARKAFVRLRNPQGTLIWLVSSCLVLFGIGFSTLSAQMPPEHKCPPGMVSNASLMRCSARRQRRPRRRPGDPQIGASYSRYSSDNQHDGSITDQQRECQAAADRERIPINPACQYTDEAVSGTVARRDGLDRLNADAEAGRFNVLYFFNLSRLARESAISMSTLKHLVHNCQVRVISVKEGIDTDRVGWEMSASLVSVYHEKFLDDLANNVHKGHVGTVLARFSAGDTRYGFHSIPSPKGETIRRGGEDRPRRIYAILDEQAQWVVQIFQWFVTEQRSLGWIVRQLNQQKAPRDRRAQSPHWHRQVVVRLLRCPKYIGIWPWGRLKNVRDPLTGDVYQEEREPDEYEPWTREFPELRIIGDEMFEKAQHRLNEQNERYGQFRRDKGRLHGSDGSSGRTHLLKGLFCCVECQSNLFVGGGHGQYLFCPGFQKGICSCKSFLPRELATQLILKAVSDRLIHNEAWVQATYEAALTHWRTLQAQQPGELDQSRQELAGIERKIKRLLDQIEEAERPDTDLTARLRERQAERNNLARRVRELESQQQAIPSEPTLEWVQERLQHLEDVLQGDTPAAQQSLRDLLDGQIEVELMSVPGRKRRFWRGNLRFNIPRVQRLLCERSLPTTSDGQVGSTADTVTIEFRRPNFLDEQVALVWPLFQQGVSLAELHRQLGIRKARLTIVMQELVKRYGNGRTAREMQKEYRQLRKRPTAFEQYIEPAMALYDEGLLVGQIAVRLGTHHNMITRALRAGHAALGKPYVNGRTRRKSLDYKGRSAWAVRMMLEERRRATG